MSKAPERDVGFELQEDKPGTSPEGVSGDKENRAFDKAAADHVHAMRRLELGAIGRLFGAEIAGQTAVATIALCLGGIFAFVCLAGALFSSQAPIFWQNFERCIAFMSACLAYIFGRASAPPPGD